MHTTSAPGRVLLALLLSFQAYACASVGTGAMPPRGGAMVTVENRNFLDLDVYAIRSGGVPRRLGMVTSASSTTFPLPRDFVAFGAVRIVAVPIGGFGAAGSGQVPVNPGQTIVFTVEENFALSSVIIR